MDLLDELKPSFERELNYRQLARQSIENYRNAFAAYRNWLNANNYPIDATCVSASRYIEYGEWLKANRAASTTNHRMKLLRVFIQWCYEMGECPSPVPAFSVPAGDRKPQVIPDDTLKALIAICKTYPRHYALRNELIVRLLLDTGMRRRELANVRIRDIDNMSISIVGKGEKPRYVYFGNNTGRVLDRYLRVRSQFPGADCGYLLLGSHGKLGRSGIYSVIKRLCERAELPHINPHAFRHTFAHDWLDNGGSPRDLMRVAGWSSEAMLDVYGAELANQRAANSHKRLSRGDRV